MALEFSLSEIARRQEVLRTNFVRDNGQLFQIVSALPDTRFHVMSLLKCPEPYREAEARRLVDEAAQCPFDLAKDSLLRALLLEVRSQEYLLVIISHQIVFDGQSYDIFYNELGSLYSSFSAGTPVSLPELSIQYSDYAYWQRDWLHGEPLERQVSYWREKLNVRFPPLNLSAARRLSTTGNSRSAFKPFDLGSDLTGRLRSLSQAEGVTAFVTLLAAFHTLLFRYTTHQDILVFTSVSGRHRNEIKGLIGLFANMIALPTRHSGDPSFRDLLSVIRQVVWEAYSYQDLPFDQLLEILRPSLHRSDGETPFEIMFMLRNESRKHLDLSGLRSRPFDTGTATAHFDLRLSMVDAQRVLTGRFEYKVELFDASVIAEMLRYFRKLLEAIVANPDQRISELPCITEGERKQLRTAQLVAEIDGIEAERLQPRSLDRRLPSPLLKDETPRSLVERQLAEIWTEQLGLERVGIRDNFFELGGRSSRVAQVIAQVREIFQISLPLRSLFEAPTIAELAEHIETLMSAQPKSSATANSESHEEGEL